MYQDASTIQTLQTAATPTISAFTSIFSFTSVSSTSTPDAPVTILEFSTTATVTLIETDDITSFPTAEVVTAFSDIYYRDILMGLDTSTYTQSSRYTILSTYSIYLPQPTDLAPGTRDEDLPCSDCPLQQVEQDPRCTALGLDTACVGQCDQRDGVWWCYDMKYNDYISNPLGRACWGNFSLFHLLVEPCIVGDHRAGCTPCQGQDYSWGPVTWV